MSSSHSSEHHIWFVQKNFHGMRIYSFVFYFKKFSSAVLHIWTWLLPTVVFFKLIALVIFEDDSMNLKKLLL